MTDHTIRWSHAGETYQADWLSSIQPNPPKWIEVIGDQTNADTAYRLASEGCGMIYQGDFQNARQLLQALARRIDKKPLKTAPTMLETPAEKIKWYPPPHQKWWSLWCGSTTSGLVSVSSFWPARMN